MRASYILSPARWYYTKFFVDALFNEYDSEDSLDSMDRYYLVNSGLNDRDLKPVSL